MLASDPPSGTARFAVHAKFGLSRFHHCMSLCPCSSAVESMRFQFHRSRALALRSQVDRADVGRVNGDSCDSSPRRCTWRGRRQHHWCPLRPQRSSRCARHTPSAGTICLRQGHERRCPRFAYTVVLDLVRDVFVLGYWRAHYSRRNNRVVTVLWQFGP